jgi:hypothetical protein
MLTVAWNREGFHVVTVLQKAGTVGTDNCCEDIPSEILRRQPVRSSRRLVIPAGDATSHTSKRKREFIEKNNLRAAPHPPFSFDLASSDFLLFWLHQRQVARDRVHGEGGPYCGNAGAFEWNSRPVLKAVFVEWEKRMQTCINAGGEHMEQVIIHTMTRVQQHSRRVGADFKRNTLYVFTSSLDDRCTMHALSAF